MRNRKNNKENSKDSVQDSWEALKADIQTRAMDFTIDSLVQISEQGDLVVPDFARPLVWNFTQKSQFIESLLLNIPVPPIFFFEDPETFQYSVLDGTQRLDAVISYLHGDYELTGLDSLVSANAMKFNELPVSMQRHLRMSTMRVVIISSESVSSVTHTVFSRLNTGGTNLSAQELRNALHQGQFNSLTLELAQISDFRQIIGAAPGNVMRDAELVLRYFFLSDGMAQGSSISQREITLFLQEKNKSSRAEIDAYRKSFIDSLQKCLAAFGSEAFRRWRPELERTDSRFSVLVFDAQMLAVSRFSRSQIVDHANQIRLGMRKLFESPDFNNSLSTTKNSLDYAVSAIAEMIESFAR